MHLTLVPAYGRDYKSKAEVQRDLEAGKDFIIATYMHPGEGKPVNAEGLRREGVKIVNIRYKRQRQIGVFHVPVSSSLAANPVFSPNPSIDPVSAAAGVGIFIGGVMLLKAIFGR